MYFIEIGYYIKSLYFFYLYLDSHKYSFYFILGCKPISIAWSWHYTLIIIIIHHGTFCDQCY